MMTKGAVLAVAAGALAQVAAAAFVEPMQHTVESLSTTLPQEMSDFTATLVEDGTKVFLFGGCFAQVKVDGECTDVSAKAYLFDPNALTSDEILVEVADAPRPRFRHGAAALSNGKVVVVGGVSTDNSDYPVEVDIYDPSTNTWESPSALQLDSGIADGTAFGLGDTVYYTGGWGADWTPVSSTIAITETAINVTGAELNEARADAGSVVFDGEAYVIGGYGASYEHIASLERFDPNENTWTLESASLTKPRGDKAAAVLNDRLYVFGGQTTGAELETIEVLHQDEWRHAGELDEQRFRFPAATIGDTVYLFGGAHVVGDQKDVESNADAEVTLLGTIIAFTEVSDLYSSSTITLHGSGTTNPSSFFWHVFNLFHSGTRIPIKMSYRAIGSGDGQAEMLGDSSTAYLPYTQFGSGDIPFDNEDYETITEHHNIAQFPFAFGAISVYVNIPELRSVEDRKLVISACGLAKIYNGGYSTWSELADEHEDNEWIRDIDEDIKAVHRTSGSSSTSGFTTYMNSQCESEWIADNVGSKLSTWPCDLTGTCESDAGSGGIQDHLEDTEYSIGYLSVSHGYPDSLTEIHMYNKNGDLVQASADGIAAAADAFNGWPSNVTSDFSGVNLIDTDGEGAWPIVLVSYIYVREDLSTMGSSAALLKAFLTYVLDADLGQTLMQDYSFSPLTDSIRELCENGLANLEMPDDVEEFIFETDTQVITGAGPYVISEKREVVSQQAIEDLQTKYEALTATTSELSAQVAEIEDDDDHDHDDDDSSSHIHHEVDTAIAIAVAALIFAVIDMIILVIVLVMMCKVRSSVRNAKRVSQTGRPIDDDNLSQGSGASASAAIRVV
ncbi:Kelch-like protein 20 [Hondaea fermentalgiana]|uniref:Kelch-like protein 20 n=1 Tax=Hondaea fermentalgiana TaxID=2315210 RepID=A0A2R5GGL2_9STRA|nr:Kelch-like protein 20 [Hondaea fermentalgiana]|eukprot:GBG30046.1 Kelch-like protein 20 [Hondaea fermentalgiana]